MYHIPGKKIGVTRNLNTRVTLIQGYKEGEYEVLEQSEDIDYISDREIELQKSYGYKVDRQKYNNLIKSNKMEINVTESTTTFPVPKKKLKGRLMDQVGLRWQTTHGEFELNADSIQWILKNSNTSMFNDKRCFIYNKAFAEFCKSIDVSDEFLNKDTLLTGALSTTTPVPVVITKPKKVKELKIFKKIRSWATERGLYVSGDPITQYVKLQEEAGELAKALLKNDQPEIVDAIGDMVVVLTNLAHLQGYDIEYCIDEAHKVIATRTGKMINGTFVKDAD
jgi:NTP pyrophosphatase (non-canonical NTP hydrolase)